MEPGARIAEGWIGRYEILARIGEGGMAETWLCRAPDGSAGSASSTPVVVKTLRPGCRSRQHQAMFRDEAMVGRSLHHPNLAQVFEFGTAADGPYLVQQYIDGPNLTQLIQAQEIHGTFDLRLAARIVADAAEALDYAYHARDSEGRPLYVVHRDVSPSNLLVGMDGITRLIDFGVATYAGREARTESGVLKGKLLFMAPEVLLDQDWSHRSDLSSLGMVLHWLLVGCKPAWQPPEDGSLGPGQRDADLLPRLHGRLTPPSVARPDLPRALEDIVTRCLQVAPSRRFARGNHLAEALRDWMRSEPDGLVSDLEVAAKVAPLFQDPRVDWRACYDFTVSQPPTVSTRPPASRRAGLRLPAPPAVASMGIGALVAIGALVLLFRTPEPTAGRDTLSAELAAVDAALDAGELDLAGRRLADLDDHTADEPLRADREDRYALLRRLEAVRTGLTAAPDLALEEARALAVEHPDDAEVQATLATVWAVLTAGSATPPPSTLQPPQPPHRRTEPLDILGSR